MGTEVDLSFTSLRAQLENEKSSLYRIDESIKKVVQVSGRYPNDRFNNAGQGGLGRGGPRLDRNNTFNDNWAKSDDPLKRKHETKTVFSRVSGRPADDEDLDEGPLGKRGRVSSAVTRDLPSKQEVLRAQCTDEQAKSRNRRMFGSLLGTLQKFKQEEIVLKTKEEKKAQVERKIEEQARQERENQIKERKTLFAERDMKKATIKALEAKMARMQEFEKWESGQKSLVNFILTKSKPHIYWLPKKMNDKAAEKLSASRKNQERFMENKKLELQEELKRIENRCLRNKPSAGPGAKENDPDITDDFNDTVKDDLNNSSTLSPAKQDDRKKNDSEHDSRRLDNKDENSKTSPKNSPSKRDKFRTDSNDDKDEIAVDTYDKEDSPVKNNVSDEILTSFEERDPEVVNGNAVEEPANSHASENETQEKTEEDQLQNEATENSESKIENEDNNETIPSVE